MDFTGTLSNIIIDYRSRKPVISFQVNEEPNGLDELQGKELTLKVVRKTKSRSLDSNAYAWVLMSKIAEKMKTSKDEVYELMLRRYGVLDSLEDGKHIPIALRNDIPISVLDGHWLPYKQEGNCTYYLQIKGSSEYNVQEMQTFVDGIVSEAKELGISTATPNQILEMQALWERHYEKQVQRKEG